MLTEAGPWFEQQFPVSIHSYYTFPLPTYQGNILFVYLNCYIWLVELLHEQLQEFSTRPATVKLHDAIRMDEDPMYLWDMAATDTITFFIISVNATPKNARQDARRTYWRHGSVRGTDGNFQDQASCCWFHRYMVSIMFAIRTAEMVRDSGVILAVCRWDSRLWRW